jgi:hypothetical protein
MKSLADSDCALQGRDRYKDLPRERRFGARFVKYQEIN